MGKYMEEGDFGVVLNIIRSVHETIKEVRKPSSHNLFNKGQINQTLLRSGMLSEIIRATRKAEQENCSPGYFRTHSAPCSH